MSPYLPQTDTDFSFKLKTCWCQRVRTLKSQHGPKVTAVTNLLICQSRQLQGFRPYEGGIQGGRPGKMLWHQIGKLRKLGSCQPKYESDGSATNFRRLCATWRSWVRWGRKAGRCLRKLGLGWHLSQSTSEQTPEICSYLL